MTGRETAVQEKEVTRERQGRVLPESFLKLTPDFCQNTPDFPPDSKITQKWGQLGTANPIHT